MAVSGSTSGQIVIVDYGMGNLHSVRKRLLRYGCDVACSSDPETIAAAGKLILPGVGHFQRAMANLASMHLVNVLNDFVQVQKKPILGICLGMQLMANRSEEGEAPGLGWIDGDVVRFRPQDTLKFKVPHVGWNQISIVKESLLMKGVPDSSQFYFVHSYFFRPRLTADVLNMTEFDHPFVSAVERGNIWGVQYHPEKSHDVGDKLLRNFVAI